METFQTYGWTVFELCLPKSGKVHKGHFKLPLFKPPLVMNLDMRDLYSLARLESHLWLRLGGPSDDFDQADHSHHSRYHLPPPYTLAAPADVSTAGYDPNYRCEGVDLHLHWAKGYRHLRHVRVAACLQLGKEIVSQGTGG